MVKAIEKKKINLLNVNFPYYHELSALYCIHIVRRRSVLVTHWSIRIKKIIIKLDNDLDLTCSASLDTPNNSM